MKKLSLLLVAVSTLLLSACGQSPSEPFDVIQTSQQSTPPGQGAFPTLPLTPPTTNTPSDPAAPAENEGSPLYEFQVRGVGYDTPVQITVPVKNVLKVKFKPGTADDTILDSGYTANYAYLAVYVKVGTLDQPTQLLWNGFTMSGAVGEAQESSIMNYSTSFAKTCAASDTDCRQDVTITIHKPNYDYWCFNYQYACVPGWTHVWPTHPWNGTLIVQTDDTVAFDN